MLFLWGRCLPHSPLLSLGHFHIFLVGAPIVQSKLDTAFPRLRLSVQNFGKSFGQSRSVDWILDCVSSHCGDVGVQCALTSASGVDSFGLSVPAVGPGRGWASTPRRRPLVLAVGGSPPLVAGRGSWAWVGPTSRRRPWVPGVGGPPPLVAGRWSSPWVGPHPSSPAVGPGRGWAPTFRRRPWVLAVGGSPPFVAGRGSSPWVGPHPSSPAVGPGRGCASVCSRRWRCRPCVFVWHHGSFRATVSIRRILVKVCC